MADHPAVSRGCEISGGLGVADGSDEAGAHVECRVHLGVGNVALLLDKVEDRLGVEGVVDNVAVLAEPLEVPPAAAGDVGRAANVVSSEERRVGKECRL